MSEKSSNRNANRASSSKQRRNQKQDRQEGSEDISGYRQKIRDNKKAESNKAKNGCFPKFLVMLVPLLILGTYLILG